MTNATLKQDLAWRHRVLLVVEDPSTHQQLAAQYVPVDLVRNGVTYIILYSMFATLLFVLLCAVLFKNGLSPQKRRLPFVWVLGFALLGGLLGSTLNTVFWAYQLFGTVSQDTMFRLWMSSTAMLYIVPLVTHFAIQLRLLSFYPTTLASRKKRTIISIVPSLLKVARLTTISITLHNSAAAYSQHGFGFVVSTAANDTSNLFTLIFQLADTVYASLFLLWRYWHLGRRDNELMQKKSHPVLRWSKQLMFAIAFGYVLPTIYAFALVLSKALSLSAVDMGFMLVANVYVQAFGAVLASLSSAYKWREDRFTDDLAPDNAVLPGMRNASDPFATGIILARDSRNVHALDSSMLDTSTSTKPCFFTSRLPSLDSRRRVANHLTTPESDAAPTGLTAIVTDGIGVTTPSGLASGDVSPKSTALRQADSVDDHNPDVERGAVQTINFPTTFAVHMQQSESRRSSDATLFAPSAALDKAEGSLPKARPSSSDGKLTTPPQSRPGTGGNGRMQRHGSGMSVPIDGSLREEEENTVSPTP